MRKTAYKHLMGIALEEARQSFRVGNKGFGAVLVRDGKIIAQAHDTEVTMADPTAHAEMNVIRAAAEEFGRDLIGCTLFSTHEPCPMCTGAIIWSNISEVVYAVSTSDSVKLGMNLVNLGCKEIFKRSDCRIKVTGGVLKEECMSLYDGVVRGLIKLFRVKEEGKWKNLERDLKRRRHEWYEKNRADIKVKLKGSDVEKGYGLLLMRLGISEEEAPIVEKTEKRIIFHSRNFCPSLEACKILGLDTREVCKLVFEEPTDALIKRFNPRLKFTRNYERIRPYAECCEEIIELV